ncbi:hypothetical protein FY528_14365 [Hymenobacter lutimineralis]|uniref:DUF2029 domain-containing protein n=1 Tax=Hymenobacter lutimineralis TaxID=2606448 RepID=A0A5D6UWD0_9BACT|nr:glycosyltransferase 87 family protein [Hymenobacter lutimineralis]TYZ07876.1 hypothetical protein FY528_14365 [Hymenobacter lutimineralis]
MSTRRTAWLGTAMVLSAGAHLALAYSTPRAHTAQLLGLLLLAFAGYTALLWARVPLWLGLTVALLLRLLWLPATPALSDDYHRFRWDGLLVVHGFNPFRYQPRELVAARPPTPLPPALARELRALYPALNSPRYYSVYPPVCQAAFAAGAYLFPTSATGFIWVIRLLLLAAEALTAVLLLRLLSALQLPKTQALWYLLHPLVIVELTGNLHFEAVVIAGLLAAGALLGRGRWRASAGVLGLAVATKLLPLVALPLLVRRLGWRRAVGYGLLCGLTTLLLFAPFLTPDLLQHIGQSLGLYFRTFEFNASLYYLLRALGYLYWGYNKIALIGPGLALLAAVGMLGIAWREKRPTVATLPGTLLLLLTLYYLMATVVHPWYLTPLVALSVFTPYRFALVWGAMAVVSYAAYQFSGYAENPWLLGVEYAVVLLVLVVEQPWRAALARLAKN